LRQAAATQTRETGIGRSGLARCSPSTRHSQVLWGIQRQPTATTCCTGEYLAADPPFHFLLHHRLPDQDRTDGSVHTPRAGVHFLHSCHLADTGLPYSLLRPVVRNHDDDDNEHPRLTRLQQTNHESLVSISRGHALPSPSQLNDTTHNPHRIRQLTHHLLYFRVFLADHTAVHIRGQLSWSMNATRALGLGLNVKQPATLTPDAVLSTAPASPTEETPHTQFPDSRKMDKPPRSTANTMPPPNSTVASMTFGPATQQTVVTTTTTTTVSLPPLIMNPPKDLLERDPKQYPLVFTPTPRSIKRFAFDVHGRPTTFHEAEDAEETMRQHRKVQAKMQRHNGSLTYEEAREKTYETPTRGAENPRLHKSVHNIRASGAPKRTATPPSIAEAAELASLQRRVKKPRSQLHRTESETQEVPSLNQTAGSSATQVRSAKRLSDNLSHPDSFQTKRLNLVALHCVLCSTSSALTHQPWRVPKLQVQYVKIGDARSPAAVYRDYS
jgi:hypothetical protein